MYLILEEEKIEDKRRRRKVGDDAKWNWQQVEHHEHFIEGLKDPA